MPCVGGRLLGGCGRGVDNGGLSDMVLRLWYSSFFNGPTLWSMMVLQWSKGTYDAWRKEEAEGNTRMETLPYPKHEDSLVFVADHELRNPVFLRRCIMGERVGREGGEAGTRMQIGT